MTIAPKPHWSEISASKIAALIPEAWRIPETSALHVLDVPRTCGVLSAAEIEITETPAEVLVQKMGKGELKSYGVTLAFCKRAAIAQQLVRTAPIMCLCAYSSRNHR
jgi:amidase